MTAAGPLRRLAVSVASVALAGVGVAGLGPADGRAFPNPVPTADCGPGARPETDVQGRVPAEDFESGRAARGYRCNTRPVGHLDGTGGFKVLRYVDARGRECAYYDASQILPVAPPFQVTGASSGQGVRVVDMSDPAEPVVTTSITTPTMLSPHESLLVNERRGLLAAVMGNAYSSAGVLEVYDIDTDCREPVLLSRTQSATLGHESGWTRDGLTFYAASSGGQTFTAIDLTDPTAPVQLFEQYNVNYHGMRLSPDGRTLYAAHIGNDLTAVQLPGEGLRILDVSEIQDRVENPSVTVLSNLTWPEGSIPQVAEPFRRAGRDYLFQVDEFSTVGLNGTSVDPADYTVGAARIIDVTDPRRPRVVSSVRLQVHQPAERRAAAGDPGASSPVGGYTGHYCSVPTRRSPRLAACSMIASGLRVFDISDVRRPREVAYFNMPVAPGTEAADSGGASAYSQPAWDLEGRSIWYSDETSGFWAVRLTNGVQRLLR
ncbi:hypothetical protein GCM10027270_19170 [Nocardioides ginkgobilobae]